MAGLQQQWQQQWQVKAEAEQFGAPDRFGPAERYQFFFQILVVSVWGSQTMRALPSNEARFAGR